MLKKNNEQGAIQIEELMNKHQQSLDDLHMYLQNTITLKYKPSSELLNLRKIQQHLSKQKK